MKTIHQVVYVPSRSTQIRLYNLTDLHVGAAACREKSLQQLIQKIAADPQARWIGGGDYIEGIPRKADRRYMESVLAKWQHGEEDVVDLQINRVADWLEPIADKCLGMICGNHEASLLKYYDRNAYRVIVRRVAKAAGKEPGELALGVQGFIVLRVRRGKPKKYSGTVTYNIYVHHGYGGGRLPGGDALALGRVLGDYDCDLALLGHRHKIHALPKSVVGPGRETAKITERMALFCGTFLDAYIMPSNKKEPFDTYAEEKGLPPSSIGTPEIILSPSSGTISCTLTVSLNGRE